MVQLEKDDWNKVSINSVWRGVCALITSVTRWQQTCSQFPLVEPLFTLVTMATITELKCAVRETLESRGVLGQLKARIRAEVFSALDDQREPRPPLSHENLLINELIREYLEFNKYRYTASVLTAESGQPEVPLDRQFLANELRVTEDTSSKSV
ncbi:hypothetical protein PAMA_015986 [Pampus argenteus]